ncbi:unnamed protein product [Owenia fusiformis]|uniref:Uncharacterized protein n=1 Tax=Owenia fusiformis TaxID=6347 RepID=A0A8J1XTJ7_OWEFU|nr:unnamed protein product [Owenia fusiformis]
MAVEEINGYYSFQPPSLGLSIILIFLDSLMVITNIAIMYVIIRTKNLWSTSGHYMFLIALLDCTMGIIFLEVVHQVIDGKIIEIRCRIQAYMMIAVVFWRMSLFTCMSIDRAIMLKYPLRYNTMVTKLKTKIIQGVVCGFCFLFALPVLIGQYIYRDYGYLCEMNYQSHSIYSYIYFGIGMLICAILTSANVSIFKMVRTQQKKINVISVNHEGANFDMQVQKKKRADFKLQLKAVRMLFLIIGIFYIAIMPYTVFVMTYQTFTKTELKPKELTTLSLLTIRIAFISSFFIYLFTDRSYRNGFNKYVLCCKKNKVMTENEEYYKSTSKTINE